jgi:energy-coupling factor transporter ATP-binding protein EcfA2
MIIRKLFARPVDRPIEGVIKADDARYLWTEVEEYVVTNEVGQRLDRLFENYLTEKSNNGVWIAGFFGSGKSHLLKMLSLLLENREIGGGRVSDVFLSKLDDELLRGAVRRACAIPSKSILFNIDQKADAVGGDAENALLEVFAKVLNELQGFYAKLDYIAQFERDLAKRGKLEEFKAAYARVSGRSWVEDLDVIDNLENDVFAKVYAEYFGKTEDEGLRYFDRARERYRLSIEVLVERVTAYLATQPPNFRVNFFVDEVGQFIGEDSKLMLNLQTLAETLSTKCDGRVWIFVTSQGDLDRVLGELKDMQALDFSKIQARFATRMTLSSADVSEVIQRRLLAKFPEQPDELTELYSREKENLRTIFRFGEGSRSYKGYSDAEHFCRVYPFHPYQVDLFQSCIEQLSRHNAFTGKHASVGERSMLAVFQEVAKQIADKEVSHLAPFDLMFDGVKAALQGHVQASVLRAERQLTDRPLAARILKCLFLLKWVREFKTTLRNIAILLIDHIGVDIAAHEKAVQEQLNFLETESYLQRNGELYEFLTDEEKDIEVEIKNTDIDDSAVNTLLADIFFKDILRDPKLRYADNNQDYAYSRKLDDTLVGREHELAIDIISPQHANFHQPTVLAAQNTGRNELLVVLPADNRLLADARLYWKTERYTQIAQSGTLNETSQAILRERRQQNSQRRATLLERSNQLISKATIYLNGSRLDVPGADPRNRIANAFQELVRVAFPSLRMLRKRYTEADLAPILREKNDLLGGAGESLSEGEQEILTRLNRSRIGGERLHVEDLLIEFRRRPYGWYDAATLCLLARLFKRNKIEVRQGAETLTSEQLLAALSNSRVFASTAVQIQEEFDSTTVTALKKFHHEFFDRSNPGADAKSAALRLLEAIGEEVHVLDGLLAKSEKFPCVEQLRSTRERLDDLSRKDYTYPLRNLRDFRDDLLDAKEDTLDPIKAFVNGAQGALYVDLCRFLTTHSANLDAAEASQVKELREIATAPNPYRGTQLQQAKISLEAVRNQIESALERTRVWATAEVKQRVDTLQSMPEFAKLDAAARARILAPSDSIVQAIRSQPLLPVIRDSVRQYIETVFRQQLAEVAQAAAATTVKSTSGESTDTVRETPPEFVSIRELASPLGRPFLGSTEDVDRYVAEFAERLRAAIAAGKRIIP